jgi:hypothetical protein
MTMGAVQPRSGPKNRGRSLLSALLACTIVLMTVATAIGTRPRATEAQASTLDTASFAPETSLLYAAVNLDQSSDQYAQATALLDRAGLTGLIGPVASGVVPGADMTNNLDAVLGGEVGFVVNDVSGAENLDLGSVVSGDVEAVAASAASGFGAVVRASDPDAAYAEMQEELQESAEASGVEVTTSDYEGVAIESVVAPEATTDESDDENVGSMAVARVDDYVLFAAVAADLEPLIDAHAGRVPTLAESDNLADLQSRLNADHLLFAYINGPALKDALVGAADPQTETLLGNVTLNALDAYTGLVVWADDPGFRLDTISVPTTEQTDPSFMTAFDGTLDERVPSDTVLFANGQNLGESGLLDGLALLFAMGATGMVGGSGDATATPAAIDPETVLEQASDLVGFNLQTEFIDQLTGEFGLAISIANLLGPEGIGALFVSGAEDPSILSDSVSKIALLVAAAVGGETEYSTREVNDATVNVVEDDSGTVPVHVEYGVVDGELLIGYGNMLQTYVDGPAESLADNPQYQETMALLPAEHGPVFYLDLGQIIGLVETFFGSMSGAGIEDAAPECETYETQDAAQAAYDENPGSLIDLDQDFDGEACEDFFAVDASPVAEATPAGFSAIKSLATVGFEADGATGTSTILYIAP